MIISLCLGRFENVISATLSCTLDRVVEVVINKTDNKVNCTGVGGRNQKVTWQSDLPLYPDYVVGTCQAAAGDHCTGQPTVGFTPSRPSDDISTMTINANTLYSGFFGRPLVCIANTTDRCDFIDVIYPAEAVCSYVVSTAKWMINATCIISKVYSNASRYSCQFFREMSHNSQTTTVQEKQRYNTSNHEDPNYKTGKCGFNNKGIPLANGDYYYRALILPGYVSVVFGPLTVAAPTADPSITCRNTQTGYVAEHSTLDCYCAASDLGQPQGRLLVYRGNDSLFEGSYGINNVTFNVHSVNRTDNFVKCELDWITDSAQDRRVVYTLNVAYGPDFVSIGEPGLYDRHPVSPRPLTLICSATGVNPSNLTYTWGAACQSSGSTCTWTPDEGDNGKNVTCTVTNSFSNIIKSDSISLSINYPPDKAPVITGYTSGQAMYAGQSRSLTCSVTGGNPPVTSVNFGCGGQSETSYGTNKTISLTPDCTINGRACTCGAIWKNKTADWYPLTASVNLTVYYAPQRPLVSHGAELFPFVAGDRVTLVCSLNDSRSGNPPASLTWMYGQRPSGHGEIKLPLTVNSSHNGVTLGCDASNSFTIFNNTPVYTEYLLQVYYILEIEFQSLVSSTCMWSLDSNCIVKEGQRVRVNCSAQSNPSLSTVTWQHSGSSVLDIIANRSMAIDQWCNVSTITANSDPRLPLRASKALKIFTQYTGTIRQFVVNGQADVVTVNETTAVRMTCTADGRPSPALTILTDGGLVAHQPEGQAVSLQDVVSVQYDIPQAQCHHSGIYSCQAENGTTRTRVLYVNCSPRMRLHGLDLDQTIVYSDQPIRISLEITAHPKPTLQLTFLGKDQTLSQSVGRDRFDWQCGAAVEGYSNSYVCIVTIRNISSEYLGFYQLGAINELGATWKNFRIAASAKEPPTSVRLNAGEGAGIGAGVMFILMVSSIAACLLWLWRHNWVLPCNRTHDAVHTSRKLPERSLQLNEIDLRPELNDQSVYANISDLLPQATSAYESLYVTDISKGSEYAKLASRKKHRYNSKTSDK